MESCGSFPSLVLVICFSVNILVYTLRNMFIGKLLRNGNNIFEKGLFPWACYEMRTCRGNVFFLYLHIGYNLCDNESRLVPCSIIQQYKYEYVMEPVYK